MDGTKLSANSGVALWRQIALALEEEIARGSLGPGARLPTEIELAKRFSVNRHTVRRAVASLSEAGKLRVEQGRGTFVPEEILHFPLTERTRFTQIVEDGRRHPHREILATEIVKADETIAANLQLRKGAKVLRIESLSFVDDRPISLSVSYFPAARFPDLGPAIGETLSVTEALRRYGIDDYRRKSTKITAQMPNQEQSRHLRLAPNRPLLQTEKVDIDLDGEPIEYGISGFAGDRVELTIDMERLTDHP